MLKKTKIISFILAFAMVSSLFTINCFAKSNVISEDEAGTMAIIFIANSIKSGNTTWDDSTKISRIVPLYDSDNSIIAFTFELSQNGNGNGYITISASDEMNIIQEFSDTATPLYYEAPVMSSSNIQNKDSKVYFTAPLEYFVKNGNDIKDLDGNKVTKDNLEDKHIKNSEIEDSNQGIRNIIKDKGTLDLNEWMSDSVSLMTAGDGPITNSYDYVNSEYGSGWTSYAYNNNLESMIVKHLCTEEPEDNNCSLIALATIFQYLRAYYPNLTNLPSDFHTIYTMVKGCAILSNAYSARGGTDPTKIDDIANVYLSAYGYGDGKSNNDYLFSWSVVKGEIDSGRPFCVNIANGYYANHTVTAYAYSTFAKNSSHVDFLKIADGWSTASRYIDWDGLSGFTHIGIGSITKVIPY